jgi:N-acetyltransferase 10
MEANELSILISSFDIKRLESYANNLLDYHVILDLLPTLAGLYFQRRLIAPKAEAGTTAEESLKERSVKLSAIQRALLLAMGLQRKTVEEIGEELTLEPSQALAQFAKVVKKIFTVLQHIQRAAVVDALPKPLISAMTDLDDPMQPLETVEDELEEAAQVVRKELRAKAADHPESGVVESEKKALQREFINSLDLSK